MGSNERAKWVGVCAKGLIFHDGKFLIIQRSRKYDDLFAYTWEVPGGSMEDGETLEECLVREVREEVGLEIEIIRFLYSWQIHREEPQQTQGYTFLCVAPHNQVRLSYEHVDYAWICPEEISSYNFSMGIRNDFAKIDWNHLLETTNQ